MSRENVVISLDGHSECFRELKPWLPRARHEEFDNAMQEGRLVFAGGNRYFADLVASGKGKQFALNRRTKW